MYPEQDLDLLGPEALIDAIVLGQRGLADAVAAARPALVRATDELARSLRSGGRVVFVGAGNSGRLAVMEAAELPGTFGLPAKRFVGVLAGGERDGATVSDAAEDDEELAATDMARLALGDTDVIVAVAASGTTPYTLRAARSAREAGARLVTVTTRAPSPLAEMADVAVEIAVGPEVLEGSTRMAAGGAQKLVLNTITTAAMVRLGHVHGRHMIDVVPANDKLQRRAAGIVAELSDVDESTAAQALARCGGSTRAAVVHLATGRSPEEAQEIVGHHASLRDALDAARR